MPLRILPAIYTRASLAAMTLTKLAANNIQMTTNIMSIPGNLV